MEKKGRMNEKKREEKVKNGEMEKQEATEPKSMSLFRCSNLDTFHASALLTLFPFRETNVFKSAKTFDIVKVFNSCEPSMKLFYFIVLNQKCELKTV
jgi:hypothetical protein